MARGERAGGAGEATEQGAQGFIVYFPENWGVWPGERRGLDQRLHGVGPLGERCQLPRLYLAISMAGSIPCGGETMRLRVVAQLVRAGAGEADRSRGGRDAAGFGQSGDEAGLGLGRPAIGARARGDGHEGRGAVAAGFFSGGHGREGSAGEGV